MSDIKKKRRKVNRRKKKKNIALAMVILVAFSLLIGLSLTVFFPVKSISAVGSKYYDAAQIVDESGIVIGDNILRINKKEVLIKIQKRFPFIDDITIEKNLDGNLVMKIRDAKEVFSYYIDGKYYSTDKSGRVLCSYTDLPDGMLHIICEAKLDNDKLYIEIPEEKTNEIITTVSNKIEGFAIEANELDISNPYEIEMLFDKRLTVNFGDISYFQEKLSHFLKMSEEDKLKETGGIVNLSEYTPQKPVSYFVEHEKNQ